jgi:glycosyltransferase involved in cell wall biosynthesis
MATISYAVTAYNEHNELEILLDQLTMSLREKDEIVILLDEKATDEVKKVVETYYPTIHKVMSYPLNNDFATFKNTVIRMCDNDYIVFMDADEYLSDEFVSHIHQVLDMNPIVEFFQVPRWNTVEGLTDKHIQKWGWRVDELDRVNWPDYQGRVIKNHIGLQWSGKVHEQIIGWNIGTKLPDVMYIYHPKTIERQEKQNALYDKI